MGYEEQKIEGRNAVLEAFRSGKTIDKLFVLDGCQDGPVRTIVREARKHDTIINFVDKERLDQLSETDVYKRQSHNNPSQTGRPQRNCSTLKYNRNHHNRFPLRQKAPYGFLTARS